MDLNIKNTPKRARKKDLILDSAANIFSQYGYHNAKLEEITSSLKLTDKSIYYYFTSKGDLFIEVILRIQDHLDELITNVEVMECDHLSKIKFYTNKAMSINGLILLVQLPKSILDFAKYDQIKINETNQYIHWTNWFQAGQLDGSIIKGNPEEQRNFLFGSLFYLHYWSTIKSNNNYEQTHPFIESTIDRMFSTKYIISS